MTCPCLLLPRAWDFRVAGRIRALVLIMKTSHWPSMLPPTHLGVDEFEANECAGLCRIIEKRKKHLDAELGRGPASRSAEHGEFGLTSPSLLSDYQFYSFISSSTRPPLVRHHGPSDNRCSSQTQILPRPELRRCYCHYTMFRTMLSSL